MSRPRAMVPGSFSRALGPAFGAPATPLLARPARTFGKDSRGTPAEVMSQLDAEFRFTLDPCPFDDSETAGASLWGKDGLRLSWRGHRVYCNPPYSNIGPWLAKHAEADLAVYLLPVKSDLAWWHDWVMPHASEVRLYRGRLRFVGMSGGAPFPSAIVVFRPGESPPVWKSIPRPARFMKLLTQGE